LRFRLAGQDNVLALLASPKASRAVRSAAAELLLRLLCGLRRSLALACDLELSASAYGEGEAAAAAAAGVVARAGGSGGAPDLPLAGAAPPARPGDLLRGLLAAVRGAEPTCPASYPPLPPPPAGAADAWRAAAAAGAERLDVSAAVQSIALQARGPRSSLWLVFQRYCL
jgi:hypothetical protein